MNFHDWGEQGFIAHLMQQFHTEDGIFGIGDDCAVIPAGQDAVWLVTTDALVEGVHFLKEEISPVDLGYKTVAVSVSDIAAKGGTPKYGFLSIALPKEIEKTWAAALVQGIKEACKKWNILILGGDTVGSKRDIFLNFTLIGSGAKEHVKYRHSAQVNDIICVSGNLGDSGAGLKALQEKVHEPRLAHAHFHPPVKLDQGIWLAAQEGVHAMMDLSDGLDCDLKRILKSSQKGAVIETSKIPLSEPLLQFCETQGCDPLEFALTGGEDYRLLLTIDPSEFSKIEQAFQKKFGSPLFAIGHITTEELIYLKEGKPAPLNYKPFDHFK